MFEEFRKDRLEPASLDEGVLLDIVDFEVEILLELGEVILSEILLDEVKDEWPEVFRFYFH